MPQPQPESRAIVIAEIEAMGGAERSVLALSHWLWERGLAAQVVTYADHVGIAQHAHWPVEVVELRSEISTMRARRKIAALRRYFREQPGAYKPLMSGYQPALHATLAGIRGFHCLMHDTPSLFEDQRALPASGRLKRRLLDAVTGYGLRSGGHTIVTSEYLREECRRVFGVQAEIARMGGLRSASEFRPRRTAGELRMLSVSRLEKNKRLDWILRALGALERERPALSERIDWRLDVAGRGSAQGELEELAAQVGVASRVRFHGYVSDAELERMYNEAHLFLMPAVQGYGIPAAEALSRGIPVLLHRDSGISDILRETPWAVVVEGGEEAMLPALRRAIDAVISGPHLAFAPPEIPTEDAWAERVARLCGWI
jgi:glycosyltransferase involved in cell wall biosynthesis